MATIDTLQAQEIKRLKNEVEKLKADLLRQKNIGADRKTGGASNP